MIYLRYLFSFIALVSLVGCGSSPIRFRDLSTKETVHQVPNRVRISPNNKYLIAIEGHISTLGNGTFTSDTMDSLSEKITDKYVHTDIVETTKLAVSKGYDVYMPDSASSLEELLATIASVSDEHTQLMIAMSGEGDSKGFVINLVKFDSGMSLVPPGKKLYADRVIMLLRPVKGSKAVIINGCQSGCFAEAARKDPEFNGVIIAACPVGYATTECQRTGTTAIYASFLGLYQDNQSDVKNLSTVDISPGHWFENMRHKFSSIGDGGLPISYSAVIYSTSEFPF